MSRTASKDAMAMKPLLVRLHRQLQTFLQARDGNVAVIFTLALLPLVGFVGMAVDYSRANSTKTAIQAALDATALMMSKDAQKLTNDQLKQKALDVFNTLFTRPEAKNVTLETTLTSPQDGNFKLIMTASANVDATFTKVIGKDKLNVGTSSEVVWGIKKLELALALDNTGSMSSNNKMTELKKAAKSLLDTLKKAAKNTGDVKISIVPFDPTVRIATSNKNEDWIDWSEAFGKCSKSIDSDKPFTKTACQAKSGTWTPNTDKNDWKGCIIDRSQDYDTLDTAPDGTTAKKFPASSRCDTSLATVLPLTDIMGTGYNTLKDKIDDMEPSGYTNVTIGLAWAWHTLTSNVPFTGGLAPKPDLDKVIILLTDGDNTLNRWSDSSSSIDNRTKAACANVKAANIKLYTVRVINGNTSLLQGCATKPDMFYNVQNASQLNNVFTSIAQNLANLRIAK
jgi:Flp pilus assembly protein TadG